MTNEFANAARTLVEHAKEAYPHFESARGQADIAAVEALLPRRHRVDPPEYCAYCVSRAKDNMMESHDPSPSCESGKKPHCTCDICY